MERIKKEFARGILRSDKISVVRSAKNLACCRKFRADSIDPDQDVKSALGVGGSCTCIQDQIDSNRNCNYKMN